MLNWTNQFAENIVHKRMIQSQIRYCYFSHKHPKKSYGGCQYKQSTYSTINTCVFVCHFNWRLTDQPLSLYWKDLTEYF